ncbi:hypothetical protein PsorP6_004168 [Peronosclerospora sorghi]|uniref:Uncharacterized protein n=1 Tax=Peronosclerospora sorghi TaxID=230839 RepID=A0ACC0VK52_9STRA|nr:hypothetical protein PsorP6_004168 [Peronosclerospora sorghi]
MTLPCEFYRNIWGPSVEEDAAMRRRARISKCSSLSTSMTPRRSRKHVGTGHLVDIAQVAHVVTTASDFRADYGEDAQKMRFVNIWDDRSLVLASELTSNKLKDKQERGPSTADTEPDDIMSPISSRVDRITERSSESSGEEVSGLAPSSLANRLRPGQSEIVLPKLVKHSASQNAKKELNLSNLPVPPPSSHNGSVIFSAIFSEQREWSWSVKFLLGIHEPIRHALFVMDRFLEQSQSQSRPEASHTLAMETHVAEFFLWFKTYFVEYLQCQHDVKVSVLLPLLNLPVSTKQEIVYVYQDISQLLVQIQQLERALCVSGACSASSWLLRLQVLQTEIRQLNRTLHATLNMEETTLHTAMSAAFTERAFHSHIMPRIFRAIRAKRVVVPWIVERSKIWGGETEQSSIQGMLPFSAKFMYRKIWRPYFMSNVAVAMKNLNEFVDPVDSNGSLTYSERHGEMCAIM